jgi:hypothetical protein
MPHVVFFSASFGEAETSDTFLLLSGAGGNPQTAEASCQETVLDMTESSLPNLFVFSLRREEYQ